MRTRHGISLALGWALFGLGVTLPACLETRHLPGAKRTQCTSCHGDASRADLTTQAAPPVDVSGNTGPAAPGVGAHQIHLNPGATHAAIACTECHVVPRDVFDPGHIDHRPPAVLTFGTLATEGDHSPAYSYVTRTCSDTYCHQAANPVWNAPRRSDQACGTCHGLPPAAPHPQNQQCSQCHAAVVDAGRTIIAPALHVNGVVDVKPHGCTGCHGDPTRPGDEIAQAAPPIDVSGNTDPAAPGVGAHQLHLVAGPTHGAVSCTECHQIPASYSSPGHVDHPPPATITFGALASQGSPSPTFDPGALTCSGTYCHGAAAPVWHQARSSTAACGSCHGLPPALPHPQVADCSRCHGAVVDAARRFVAPELHVDGKVEVATLGCASCHGSTSSPAPPTDLSGGTDRTSPGVGAHQVHLSGGKSSRPLACGECHLVPTAIGAGHPTGWGPAQVAFSGFGADNGVAPSFAPTALTCSRTWCHGPSTPGTSVSPAWTTIGPLGCSGGCHGTPPPPPHPNNRDCWFCHSDVDTLMQITNRSQHVNGIID
jgi:predicted CxxxxCH...CXXCH cytochrome family protein